MQKALDYLLKHNEQTENRDEKWVITEGLLFSLTGSFNPAIRRFFAARQDQIEDHNRKHGLTIGHNRGRSRKDPNALPRLVQGFRENVLNEHLAPNPESPSPSPIPAANPVTSVNPSGTAVSESENPVSSSVETLKPVSLVPLWRLSLPGSHMISVAYGALDGKGIAYFSVQPFGEGVLAEALRSNRSDNLAQHTQLILHQDHHLAPINWLMVQVPHQQPFLRRIQNRIRKEAKATTRRVRDPNIEPF